MLSGKKIKAFIPTLNAARAKAFYRDVLGLTLLSEDPYALAFDAHGIMLRVTPVAALSPHPFTVLGWEVEDIASVVRALNQKGVRFERFDFLQQDELSIWNAPSGSKVAWFKDPDGNILSLTE
jgi:catechol 2,3-dioxygenase-like lactoylglutathione lyase family enzyme